MEHIPTTEDFVRARDELILSLLRVGVSQADIAKRCGMSQQAVSKAAARARQLHVARTA